jgi:hypothetical protein
MITARNSKGLISELGHLRSFVRPSGMSAWAQKSDISALTWPAPWLRRALPLSLANAVFLPKLLSLTILPVASSQSIAAGRGPRTFDYISTASLQPVSTGWIYFDADTRVCVSLEALLNAPLHGAPAGAVHDLIYYLTGNIHRRRRDLFLSANAPYLQSGVMVFDWPLMLRDDYLARARQFLESHPNRCQEAPDQDALLLQSKISTRDMRAAYGSCCSA